MTSSERSATLDVVQRVKQEIAGLTEEQSKALQLSIYVGMSRDETKKYDERLNQIKKLVAELATLVEKR